MRNTLAWMANAFVALGAKGSSPAPATDTSAGGSDWCTPGVAALVPAEMVHSTLVQVVAGSLTPCLRTAVALV